MLDLDAYLARIGVRDERPTLAQVHRAHATSIPFENLDPQRGVPVSLANGGSGAQARAGAPRRLLL